MFGMSFSSYLTLFIISLIVAGIVHYGLRYRVLEGPDGFLAKWIAGWIGGWLGSPVLGHWFAGVNVGNVYIIPAILGGFIGAFAPAAVLRARAAATSSRVMKEGHETTLHQTPKAA